jgi:hypothetical protein
LPDDQEEFETEETILWRNNYMILDCLGAGGMSSDESDVDELGHSVYRAKNMIWRDQSILRKLTDIDSHRNITNAYGNTRAGNPPRRRLHRGGQETSRKAIPGLPINFYDGNWYASLTPGQKRELDAKEEKALSF